MTTRRTFLKTSGAVAAASLLLSKNAFAAGAPRAVLPPPGIQLFTFFNTIDADVAGTLKKIAAIGYKEIESAFSKKGGYYGMKPKAFAQQVRDLGMSWKSHHVLGAQFKMPANTKPILDADGKPLTIPLMRNLKENMQQLVDEAAEGGVDYLVCANTPIETLDAVHSSIAVLNQTGEACKKAGIGFAYHNHDAEFRAVEGKVPYDLFLSDTDAALVKMELDIAWATKGGADPVVLFTQHPGRFPLWHLKDLDATQETILPLGAGTINYSRIFQNSAAAGLQHIFIEHDMPADPFASITASMVYLKRLRQA